MSDLCNLNKEASMKQWLYLTLFSLENADRKLICTS